ncbi:hypothetical protein [Streptomyces sp. NPDC059215]|uniref:hypothetical protein n=1 Tax=Streptomyces sp. NPDC059215 TaxID=3346772 RepID=UPI0036D1E265
MSIGGGSVLMARISTTSSDADFAIEIVSAGVGRVTVGAFTETFSMDLTFWDAKRYEESWARALRRVEETDMNTSCLVTFITDPKAGNFVRCWPLYRIHGEIFVQNSLIIFGDLDHSFDPENPWHSVEPREVVDEDGSNISEWHVDVGAVQRFRTVSGWA